MDSQLRELGYAIVNDKIVKAEDGSPYEFEVSPGDRTYNQRFYESLGDAATQYIQNVLTNEYFLVPIRVPVDAAEDEPTSTIYMSPNSVTSTKPLLLLVPGMNIKVAQWA
ncbi:hypothetical protein HDU76_000249 [Blyttiomyces sp. JEL0837]|nr:hypothetical protein HDU76_000249 [Blyttiomyces sp. JEL0837]